MSSYAITGTSRGLGLEFVRQLSGSPSNRVFALARNPEGAADLQKLASERKNLTLIRADVTIVEDLKAAAETISKATGGTLDVFIENAVSYDKETGALGPYDVEKDPETAKKALDRGIDVNVWSVIRGTNIFLPLIMAGKQKKVIAISTGMADVELIRKIEFPADFVYSIAKASVNILMAKYAAQLKHEGVKFLSLSPGWVDTQEPSPDHEQLVAIIKKQLSLYKPDIEGMISPQESVEKCLEVIDNLSIEQSGQFLSHLGTQQWL